VFLASLETTRTACTEYKNAKTGWPALPDTARITRGGRVRRHWMRSSRERRRRNRYLILHLPDEQRAGAQMQQLLQRLIAGLPEDIRYPMELPRCRSEFGGDRRSPELPEGSGAPGVSAVRQCEGKTKRGYCGRRGGLIREKDKTDANRRCWTR